jgi:hypothetical protein
MSLAWQSKRKFTMSNACNQGREFVAEQLVQAVSLYSPATWYILIVQALCTLSFVERMERNGYGWLWRLYHDN